MALEKKQFLEYGTISRIILGGITFSQLKLKPIDLYEIISNILLDKENLFFYCTQRNSCRTLTNTRKYVKELMKKGILMAELDTILECLNWKKDTIDIYSSTFSGDLGEYLMNIIVEKFDISRTLISKVSLKTSPSMSAYGNDNVFYDCEKNILYFGEAKFYGENTLKALIQSFDSVEKHSKSLVEISFIKNQTSSFIAENKEKLRKIEKRLETIDASKITCKSITFIISDDCYEEDEYVKTLKSFVLKKDDYKKYIKESIIVFLPIISKNDFLKYFESKVKSL